MSHDFDAKQELRNRLSKYDLENTDDLTAYVQYASRLAALGDDSGTERFPEFFAGPDFKKLLRTRCEQGFHELEEFTGRWLAMAVIDAQDYYCFWRRFKHVFYLMDNYFETWFEDAERCELDEEAVRTLEAFLKTYPISEEDRLPVVDTPVAEWEYALMNALHEGCKPLEMKVPWKPAIPRDPSVPRPFERTGNVLPSPLVLTLADGTPPELQSRVEVVVLRRKLRIERYFVKDWTLKILVSTPSG